MNNLLRTVFVAFAIVFIAAPALAAKGKRHHDRHPSTCIDFVKCLINSNYGDSKDQYDRQHMSSSTSFESRDYRKSSGGQASYYWQPQQTASGQRFNPNAFTAAHKTLPFGSKVLVTNNSNGKSVIVTINDRGPYVKGRVIDLSRAAAAEIGMIDSGVASVSLQQL